MVTILFLTSCSTIIKPDIEPSTKITKVTPLKVSKEELDSFKQRPRDIIISYRLALSTVIIERKVLYKDLLRNAKTQSKLNKKWYQFWK